MASRVRSLSNIAVCRSNSASVFAMTDKIIATQPVLMSSSSGRWAASWQCRGARYHCDIQSKRYYEEEHRVLATVLSCERHRVAHTPQDARAQHVIALGIDEYKGLNKPKTDALPNAVH